MWHAADLAGRAQRRGFRVRRGVVAPSAHSPSSPAPAPRDGSRAGGAGSAVVLQRLGTAHQSRLLPPPCRLVPVATGKTDAQGRPEGMMWVTHRLDLDADLVAVADRDRWAVEFFCRWVTWVLGCRHLGS